MIEIIRALQKLDYTVIEITDSRVVFEPTHGVWVGQSKPPTLMLEATRLTAQLVTLLLADAGRYYFQRESA